MKFLMMRQHKSAWWWFGLGAVLMLSSCASIPKAAIERLAKESSVIRLTKCPAPLTALRTSAALAKTPRCFQFIPPPTQDNPISGLPLSGIWLSGSKQTQYTPLYVLSHELKLGTAGEVLLKTNAHARTLGTRLGEQLLLIRKVLNWQGPVILWLAGAQQQHGCPQAVTQTKNTHIPPAERAAAYLSFFSACLSEKNTEATDGIHTRYSSAHYAESVAAFMTMADHHSITLLAQGYATRAALALMSKRAARIERVLFENIVPPGYDHLGELPWTLSQQLRALSSACSQAPSCSNAGALSQQLNKALKYLQKQPIIEPQQQNSQPATAYYLDAHGYLNYVMSHFQNNQQLGKLPQLLAAAARQKFPTAAELTAAISQKTREEGAWELTALFQHHLWLCQDRLNSRQFQPLRSLAAAQLSPAETATLPSALPALIYEEWMFNPCQALKHAAADNNAQAPIQMFVSNASPPLLVLTGELAAGLPTALIKHSSLKHVPLAQLRFAGESSDVLVNNTCAQAAAKAFFTLPNPTHQTTKQLTQTLSCLQAAAAKTFIFIKAR